MPTFCRHNHLLQNCTICAREQNFEARPVLSPAAPKSSEPRERTARPARERPERAPRPREPRVQRSVGGSGNAVRVKRLTRSAEDGFRSPLVPGLKSSADAERLAEEIAFASWRLSLMEQVAAGEPVIEAVPEVWREIAAPGDAGARSAVTFRHVLDGARGLQPGDRDSVLAGFEAWGARFGSFADGFQGDLAWTPQRRFERDFERLGGVHGLGRDIRYELLTLLGRLGVYELRPDRLFLSGENESTWAAKRALGIGDPLLLERRAANLAAACEAEIESLDLALYNWGSGVRIDDGLPADPLGDELVLDSARSAFGL